MKKYLISLVILLQITANSQEKITIVPKWQDKETKTLIELEDNYYIEIEEIIDTIQLGTSTNTEVIEVIKNTNSYNLIWKQKKKSYKDKLEEKYADKLFFNIRLNDKGEFIEIENKKYLYNTLLDFKDDIIKSLKEEGASKNKIKKVKSKFKEAEFTLEKLETKIKEEVNFFFHIYGKTIIINDTICYQDTIKYDIPRKVTTTAKRIDKNHILIREDYRIDKSNITEILVEADDYLTEDDYESDFEEVLEDIEE